MTRTLSALVGYDPELVKPLAARRRAELELIGAGWCWAVLILSASLAYALALLTSSLWLGFAAAAGMGLLLLQLVRLTVAGGGVPLDQPAASHRPGRAPLLWLALLGAMFAQPAQLPLWPSHASLVAQERARLVALHGASDDDYARGLAECEFLVLRVQAVWREPARAARYTLGYLALVLIPILFARAQGRSALQAYEARRARQLRALVARDAAAAEHAVARALEPYRKRARA